MTEKESPEERARRLIEQAKAEGKGETPSDDEPPEVIRELLEKMLGELKDKLGGQIEIHEVKMEKKAPKPPSDRPEVLGFPANMEPIERITNDRARQHAVGMIALHNEHKGFLLEETDMEVPQMQFAVAVSRVYAQAAMSATMMVAAQKGQIGITPDDMVVGITGSMATAIITALRYGQAHPDALTGADGVSDDELAAAVEKLLASSQEDDNKEEEN